MQLRFKKIILLSTIIVYCASFLLQSNLALFETWAKENNGPRVNIVAILVDDKIYNWISGWLQWYASDYIQWKLADTKALVMPIDLENIHAYDIYRMMENIYFDWLKDINSQLIWLIMFWDIPLPVVNQDSYVFPTVFPYVDFENQKYIWDEDSQYFVPNWNPWWQAEIWHWLVNYGGDVSQYLKFFKKIKEYSANPDDFIWDSIWYEDFIAQKDAFLDDNYQYYRNNVMFGEDLWYQRHSTLMKKLFWGESANNSADIVSELSDVMENNFEWYDSVESIISQTSEAMHTTKMVQQEIKTSYLADYNELFSKSILSTIRENIFAWWRWIKLFYDEKWQANKVVDADNSASMIQLKDTMYLWNENLQWLIENLNMLMEEMVDKKIADNKYDMDIVIPVSYEKIRAKRLFAWLFNGRRCFRFVDHYDNFYFWNNARYVDSAKDLSIYRWTYRNLSDLDGVTYDSLQEWYNPVISEYDPVDFKFKSIWSSYGIFSNQVEGNRWYRLTAVDQDLDIYDEEKTAKDEDTSRSWFLGRVRDIAWPEYCAMDDEDHPCENLFDFAQRWWWWASSINLDENSIPQWRYKINGLKATDSRRYIFDMWWFQSLASGVDEWDAWRWWVDWSWVWPQKAGANYEAFEKYASPTQTQWWKSSWWYYDRYTNHTPDKHIDFSLVNYWQLPTDVLKWDYIGESDNIFTLNWRASSSSCRWFSWKTLSEKYSYKVVSSIVKHTSTTEDEINWIDRNRYGEWWTLWWYYMSLKNSYENVKTDALGIVKELLALEASVKETNDNIEKIAESLNGNGDKLKWIVDDIDRLNNEINSLKNRLAERKNERALYQRNYDSAEDSDKSYWSGKIRDADADIIAINNSINEKEQEKKVAEENKGSVESIISSLLDDISKDIELEKKQLTDVYNLMTSLSADDLFYVMEYIANVEWINPEDFYLWKENLTKVWFLSQWISELEGMRNEVKNTWSSVIASYKSVYGLVSEQKESWNNLAAKLKSISDAYSGKVDKVSGIMDVIFIVSEENSDWEEVEEGDWEDDEVDNWEEWEDSKTFELKETSADEIIAWVWWLFDKLEWNKSIKDMFNWLIEVDTVGPAIVNAAQHDGEFIGWLKEKGIKYWSFTQSDWINQYAQWTKWPWYDSEWAKKNHDLLLWVSEHMSWMNILTPDRPIDSPRYISMQSVHWDEMKFIYPDLFKVEVYVLTWKNKSGYDIHELLTWWQIKENLIDYLTWKVFEYNEILKEKCNWALEMDDYFKTLNKYGYKWATPDRWVHGCGKEFTYDEFVEALWWEEMLTVISDILYYQNLTNKKKLWSWSVSEDIELIKKGFSLNDKREQTLKDYLTFWNEKILNPLMVIPTYELSWYEVAYVNSNWKDYIIPDDEEDSESISWLTKSNQLINFSYSRSKGGNKQPSKPEADLNDECNIPIDGKLPLFKLDWTSVSSPWYEWLKCWFKKIKKDPLKVKLTFDSSLGEILSADSLSDFIKNSDLWESFTDWWDAWTKYADEWDKLIDPDTDFDSDKNITEMQVKAEQNNENLMSWSDWYSDMISAISKNVKINNSNDLLSDSNPTSELSIVSVTNIWTLDFIFMWTWDGCIALNDNHLCGGSSITMSFNPNTNPFTGLVMSADHIAWKVGLDIKIGVWWEYYEKVIKYSVSPSELIDADIIFWDDKAVAWMITPVEVIWFDEYDNHISWWLKKYKFTVSQGRFLKDWAYQDSFVTNDFRNLRFYYQAPLDAQDNSKAIIQISEADYPYEPLATKSIQVVQASPEIKLNSNIILKWKDDLEADDFYRLKSFENVYAWNVLQVSSLQRLDIDMKDASWKLIDIDSQILVTSQNWLVVIWQVQKQENGDDMLFETSKHYMVDGHVTVYYYPTTVAWNEIINIDIPWLDTRVINLAILPSTLANVLILPEKDVVDLWKTIGLELFLSDVWWNLVDTTNIVNLAFDDEKIEFVEYPWAKESINVTVEKWYKKLNILWTGAWLTYIIWWWTYVPINVDKHIFPNSWLNIMYLNYFWNDWGNQWWYFSDNDNYVEDLMMKSDKVITTTTQLISDDKIKRMVWKIQPWFKISNVDNLNTVLTIRSWIMDMIIWWASSMSVGLPLLPWMSVTSDKMESMLSNNVWSYIFFIPSDKKYTMSGNWILYNSWDYVWSILSWEISLSLTRYLTDSGDNIWSVVNKWINYWNVVIHYSGFAPSISDFTTPGEWYLVNETFSNWSTDNLSSVWIFDALSEFELDTNYKSIQNSDEIEEWVWFLSDFKNITLFAEWEIVWEATKKFGSEFVINLGDPVLSRKNPNDVVYGTKFDWWIWNEIFVDSEKDIFWTYLIDFNNDSLKDLLVVYMDWTVKLAKNYWGTPDLRNMQELMRIAVGIEDVYIWDVDGNKYEDIIIHTNNNQLRTYLNDKWVFDVDWKVACLNQNVFEWEISKTPSSLDWIFQIFVEDMDWDNVTDIVTYDDKWYIKVFYWWTTDWWPNYLSIDKYSCDSWWYDREIPNTTIVTALWVQVSWDPVFDNSLLHRTGMSRPVINITKPELPIYWVKFDPDTLLSWIVSREWNSDWNISKVTSDIMEGFDVKQASQQYVDEWAKFVDITLYENKLDYESNVNWWLWMNNYLFAPSSFLDPDDPNDIGSVWKTYSVKSWSDILQDGDIVTVMVTVKASNLYPFQGAYGDIIQWPWNLYFDEDKIFKWIEFIHNPSNAVVKKRDWSFAYIIDHISLAPGDKLVFKYDLEYHHIPLKKISITYDTFYWEWPLPDIKLQATDWCDKNFDVYINGWRWSFAKKIIYLQKMINNEYLDEDAKTEDYAQDVIGIWSDVNQLPWIQWDKISRISLLGRNPIEISDDEEGRGELKNAISQMLADWWLEALNLDFNIDLNLFEKQTDIIENVVDDIMKWMCNWFSFWWSNNCKWLPVPFNQAFLAPGQYHIFGCRNLPVSPLDWWLPVFFFPGTIYVFWAPIPIPWWLKQPASDGFLWPWGWAYPSFIRIYAAPTLTAQLWVAICMWPYAAWAAIPSPFSDIWGNCVVFAVKPQCKGWGDDGFWEKTDLDNPNQEYPSFIEDVRDSWTCLQSQKWPVVTKKWQRSSPFDLYSYTSKVSNSNWNWKDFSMRETLNTIWGGDKTFFENVYNNMDVNWWSYNDVEYETSLLWIISLETSSFVGADWDIPDNMKASIVIWDVDILWWGFNVNKIRSWLQQWLRKVIIDKWLDPQIRYILNQLTKMHINIKFPNISRLIDSEVASLKDISSNFWKDKSKSNDYSRTASIWSGSKWDWISSDSLNIINDKIGNPFEALSSLMDESNIINISTETLTVKVPMIFAEDINAYEFYLRQWLETNNKIMEEWKSLLQTFVNNCSKEPTEEKQQQCRKEALENLNSFIEFESWDWWRMQDQIYANIVILQEYREFPFEIYEWIHVIDRYMSELASLINNTVWYLSYWTSTNSERFVWYVDAIVLIVNIIKTYQLLIDFSIERWQNCGNCAKDTYDQYSCKLSMLCDLINIPIIEIPNFKLPNITIDLTNIDLSLDILLPSFNFQPVKINLPELPNLPEPPSFSINIKLFDLPNIPLLPEPPELPELPSFIPEVELELPMLPPAPEVPKLPNSIEGAIKIAKLIWKIYCIVKWQFWLVWEKSVKAKIEQLTQRTYEVEWIDNIMDLTNRSAAPIKNYGVDYEIDSYLDLQFNFADFYNYLDTLTKDINNLTNIATNFVNEQVGDLNDELNSIGEVLEEVDGVSIGVEWKVFGDGWVISKADADIKWITSDNIEYVDYESGKGRLKDVLAYFKQEVNSTSFNDSIGWSLNNIENQIDRHNSITPNEEWIESVRETVLDYLDKQKVNYDSLANMINSDYDGFLAMISSWDGNNSVLGDEDKLLTFNVQLFNLDSAAKDSITKISKSNPYKALLDNKQTIIDWYRNAINTNTASDLWLTKSQYLVLRDNIYSMKGQMNVLYDLVMPESPTRLLSRNSSQSTNKTLVAWWWARLWSQLDVASVIDPSLLSDWIYERNAGWKFTKVVYSDSFAEAMKDTHYRTTHTSDHDIILWNEDSIYKKCYNQSCVAYWWWDSWYYVSSTIKEIPYKEKWLVFNDDSLELKIADVEEEVKNWKVSGQTYDVLSFSWDLDDVDAYLIKLVERIDHSYEKVDYAWKEAVHYVLALPDYIVVDEEYAKNTKLELLNKKINTIQNLSWGSLLQIVYYDSNKSSVNVGISNLDRKWYYSRIAALNLVDDTFMIDSPWSNQVVAWRQIVWDDVPPSGEPLLYRPSVDQVVSEWDDLEWYVWTRYKLIINWEDNVALSYINIAKDWKILAEKYTSDVKDSVSTDIDIHTKSEKEIFTTKWIDQFGNKTEKEVTITYYIPDITITDISRNADWETVAITAELSQDIDQGNVSFQRRRWEVWKTMKRKGFECADLKLSPWEKVKIWSPYSAWNEIAMYDKDGGVMALMNPDTAEIKLQSGYKDNYEVNVIVQNSAVLQVCNKKDKDIVFSISIPTKECWNIVADGYEVVDLPEDWRMGMFNGWKAVYKDWEIILLASPTCHLYSEIWLNWSYSYDIWQQSVVLTLYPANDIQKSNPIKVWFKVKPFLES